jgi:p-hydroxybenzoate 3-monooxygenase
MTPGGDVWPVVIVGAGPAGLVLAWVLHRAGVPVLVLERSTREELGRLSKAGAMEHRVARMLEREGLGAPILALGQENHRCEFRTPQASTVVEYGALTGGRGHVLLPQHLLVDRVCGALVDVGVPMWFSHGVREVRDGPDEAVLTVEQPGGTERPLRARVVIGADGAAGVVANAVTAAPEVRVHDRRLPGRWLVIAAATPPLVGHTIYAAHPRGFASHLRRGPDETRFYLEIAGDQEAADWSMDEIRAELGERLGVGTALEDARIDAVGTLDLRTRVVEPMQHGRLVLIGDAAHLITPAGGKGMNLALVDAVELGHALADGLGSAGDARWRAFSDTRLAAIWRTQAFSDWLLRILSARSAGATGGAGDDGGAARDFGLGLREGWVDALGSDPLLARWFAHAYAGVDP